MRICNPDNVDFFSNVVVQYSFIMRIFIRFTNSLLFLLAAEVFALRLGIDKTILKFLSFCEIIFWLGKLWDRRYGVLLITLCKKIQAGFLSIETCSKSHHLSLIQEKHCVLIDCSLQKLPWSICERFESPMIKVVEFFFMCRLVQIHAPFLFIWYDTLIEGNFPHWIFVIHLSRFLKDGIYRSHYFSQNHLLCQLF